MQIHDHRFGSGMDLQLFIDMTNVSSDRCEADIQIAGNMLVSDAFGQAVQNHLFPRGQIAKFPAALDFLE